MLGESLAHSGRPQAPEACTAAPVAVGEWANMRLRSSRFGQLTFTSTATTHGGASASSDAARA